VGEILWLGVLLGAGAALSVGPIFVTIVQEAATRGFGASLRVILGSATADLILLVPALAFAWIIAAVAGATFWVGVVGGVFFLFLAGQAVRDARSLWKRDAPEPASGWAFWKGVVANLANPLTWTFWVATGTPTMVRAQHIGGRGGLLLFTVTWFVVACGLEAVIALVVARSGKRLGGQGRAVLTGGSAILFVALATVLLVRDVVPDLLPG
jgi:threonine/homoserine/homoserine lactone efflux protein